MLYAWRDFSTFHSLGFFEIGGCHLVALAERSSNLHSNLKMINHRPHNLGFRLKVRIADTRRVRPGPPAEGPSSALVDHEAAADAPYGAPYLQQRANNQPSLPARRRGQPSRYDRRVGLSADGTERGEPIIAAIST